MQNITKLLTTLAVTVPVVAAAVAAQATSATLDSTIKNNTYVTLAGTVGDVIDADEFYLNHSGGTIKVDTNDHWPNLFAKDAIEVVKPGDRVTVTGLVDDNLFTRKEIDATSISHRGQTYSRVYWQTPYDMAYQGYWPYYGWDDKRYEDNVSVSGQVTRIIDNDEIEMKYGTGILKVKTDDVLFPDASANLRVGDRITVIGDMDDNWFGKRELDAESIIRTNVYQSRG